MAAVQLCFWCCIAVVGTGASASAALQALVDAELSDAVEPLQHVRWMMI